MYFNSIFSYSFYIKIEEVSQLDTKKIGGFLKELRKQNNMTQEQLGERIGVTNKTISRWETGNYMPPIECLKLLSDIYQISINEIIAGKILNEENYKQESEENITIAFEAMEARNEKLENILISVIGITTVLAISIMFLLPDGESLSSFEKVKEILVVVFVWALAIISNSLNLVAMSLRKSKSF